MISIPGIKGSHEYHCNHDIQYVEFTPLGQADTSFVARMMR